MAENEIQILIKAVDEATATMKNIEKQVVSTAKNSEKANKSLSQSFSAVQGAMLNLGQIAQGVHNIFETGERATRNLENAQDRLENATLRLKNAQQDLNDVSKSFARQNLDLEKATIANTRAQEELKVFTDRLAKGVKFTDERLKEYEDAQINAKEAALDLADAQQAVSDQSKVLQEKQDAVTISSNNLDRATRGLEKATNDAKWAYVDMGIQAVSVAGNMAMFVQSLPTLIAMLGGTTTALGGMSAAAGTASTAVGTAGLMGALSPLIALAAAGGIIIPIAIAVHGNAEGAKAYQGAFGGASEVQSSSDFQMPTGTRQLDIGNLFPELKNITIQAQDAQVPVSELSNLVGGPTPESLNSNIVTTTDGWAKMGVEANTNIDNIQINLSEIPTDVYTYHHIITVYE